MRSAFSLLVFACFCGCVGVSSSTADATMSVDASVFDASVDADGGFDASMPPDASAQPDASTAPDASTQSANTTLASLFTSVGTLTPTFRPTVFDYALTVPNVVTSLSVSASTVDPSASISISGAARSTATQTRAVSLQVGANAVPINVTAADAVTSRTTTLNVTRLASGTALCEATGGAHCYYATPSGNGDCSFASPCSIQSALGHVGGGDYLYLRAGTYSTYYANYQLEAIINLDKYFHAQSPTPTNGARMTIKGYPGEHALLHGNDTTPCVFVDNSNVTIDGLEIEHCWRGGVVLGEDVSISNVTVQNSNIHDISCDDNMGSVFVHGAHNVLIDHNVFHDNYYAGTKGDVGTPNCRGNALILFTAVDVTVSNNDVYRTCGGMYYKHGEHEPGAGGYTRIIGNHFHDYAGIAFNQNRTEIRHNVIEGRLELHNEDGTYAPFTLGVVIAQNTFINGGVAFPYQGGAGKNYQPGQFPGAIGTTVENNIFFSTSYEIWPYGSDAVFNAGIDLTSDSNCFFNPTKAQSIRYFGGGASYGSTHGGVYSLPQWKGLGYDSHSVEVNPQFVNVDAGDFHTAATSPCAAMGAYSR